MEKEKHFLRVKFQLMYVDELMGLEKSPLGSSHCSNDNLGQEPSASDKTRGQNCDAKLDIT